MACRSVCRQKRRTQCAKTRGRAAAHADNDGGELRACEERGIAAEDMAVVDARIHRLACLTDRLISCQKIAHNEARRVAHLAF